MFVFRLLFLVVVNLHFVFLYLDFGIGQYLLTVVLLIFRILCRQVPGLLEIFSVWRYVQFGICGLGFGVSYSAILVFVAATCLLVCICICPPV